MAVDEFQKHPSELPLARRPVAEVKAFNTSSIAFFCAGVIAILARSRGADGKGRLGGCALSHGHVSLSPPPFILPLMSNILPDEILSEILSPALKVSGDLFSDTSDVSPFANYSPSTSAYLLVCKDWLRVATPLLYNVVVLRSKPQANALERVLRNNPEFGRFIKKLRVEGGYGMAMHTILQSARKITDIFLSLSIWSSDSTQGLCKGLPLINPHRAIVVDPHQFSKPLKNKHLAALRQALFSCLQQWDHLKIFGFPYVYKIDEALSLSHALAQSQTVTTITISKSIYDPADLLDPLLKIPSLQTFQLQAPLTKHVDGPLIAAIESNPQLKALVQYTVVDPTAAAEGSSLAPEIAPSLNPSFVPMKEASEETRERVWKRVLFFATYVEEPQIRRSPPHPNKSLPPKSRKSYPSRFQVPILQVSKYFHRLALPYLYECLSISAGTASNLAQQLQDRPELGSSIRRIFIRGARIPEPTMLAILSRATKVEKIWTDTAATNSFSEKLSASAFKLIARTAGSSLREFSNCFRGPLSISTATFAHLTELRVLEFSASSFTYRSDSVAENVMSKLHTLRIGGCNSLLEAFSTMRLASLHTLKLPGDTPNPYALPKLLNAHRDHILHLSLGYLGIKNLNIYDVCKNLVDIELTSNCIIADLICNTPHESLATIVAYDLVGDPEALDPAMFPALRKIQIRCEWPTTERDILKSELVTMAEALLRKNITLADSNGKGWTPRVKSSRGRK
ncbi:hypothetical protein FB451DRAFT_285988 [Mycena latifolia]|nr:hypothetical protein FB451DRAFT_285988 [Mycena latifolia]